MKEIKAFIKPKRLGNVVEALKEKGFDCVTLSECEGTGSYKREDSTPSLKYLFTDSKIIKLEIVCQDDKQQDIIQIICKSASTDYPGDGIIYVTDVIEAFKIKTCISLTK